MFAGFCTFLKNIHYSKASNYRCLRLWTKKRRLFCRQPKSTEIVSENLQILRKVYGKAEGAGFQLYQIRILYNWGMKNRVVAPRLLNIANFKWQLIYAYGADICRSDRCRRLILSKWLCIKRPHSTLMYQCSALDSISSIHDKSVESIFQQSSVGNSNEMADRSWCQLF